MRKHLLPELPKGDLGCACLLRGSVSRERIIVQAMLAGPRIEPRSVRKYGRHCLH